MAASISQGLADNSVVAEIVYGQCEGYDEAKEGDEGVDTIMEDAEIGSDGEEEGGEGGVIKSAVKKEKVVLWDMSRPLVGNCEKINFLKFDDPKAKAVFWHSSAHVLGCALEHLYGCYLTIGPPIKSGFYYDMYVGDKVIKEEDYTKIDKEITAAVVKKKYKFERLVVTKDEVRGG